MNTNVHCVNIQKLHTCTKRRLQNLIFYFMGSLTQSYLQKPIDDNKCTAQLWLMKKLKLVHTKSILQNYMKAEVDST